MCLLVQVFGFRGYVKVGTDADVKLYIISATQDNGLRVGRSSCTVLPDPGC